MTPSKPDPNSSSSAIAGHDVEQILSVLETELPHLFEQDISYHIYTNDISFKDPVNTFKGKFNYRLIFWTLRFHGKLFFTQLSFDLHETGRTAADEIRAEWTVRGTLRLPWHPQILFNGFSIYRLNEQGLIFEHVDSWDRPPMEILRQFFQRPGTDADASSKALR